MEGTQKKLVEGKVLEEYSLADVLKLFSYGSDLREALVRISKSNRGALIVLSENAREIADGGFAINSRFTLNRLAELAKLDGAIIVDSKLKKILYANALLIPDSKIKSDETGTRHKAAERTARQLGVIVICVSEKSSIINVYYGNKRYVLNDLSELLYKAREVIENLEGQRTELDMYLKKFDLLEVSALVTVPDLALIINRLILFFRDCEVCSIYIAELGRYGETLKARYNLVTSGLKEELNNIQKDYNKYLRTDDIVKKIKSLKTPTIEQSVKIINGYFANSAQNENSNYLVPFGYRLLSKIQLTRGEVENLITHFREIKRILYASADDLSKIEGLDEKKAKLIKGFLVDKIEMIQ
ncbi:MAG: DNA integrity scanning diadenylate cyclase DisA [archaeon]